MTQASQKIMQQYKDGGVIPAQLVGQDAVSKTYVDGQLAQRDANISSAHNAANKAQKTINDHINSTTAHAAQNITYNGEVINARNAKQAIDFLDNRIDNIVAQSGNDNTEIRDARGGFPVLSERLDDSDARMAQKIDQKVIAQGLYTLSESGFPKFTKYASNPIVLGNPETQNQAGFATVICTDGIITNPIDKFYMYWAGHDGGGIWLSTAPHPLGPWTTYGRVITDASMYDSQAEYDSLPAHHISSPDVHYISELGVIRMYFHRLTATGQISEYCHSTNGLSWTKQPGKIIDASLDGSWSEAEVSYLRVTQVNEVFYATYQGRDRRQNVKGMGFGISNDGVKFTWSKIPLFYNTEFANEYNARADMGGAPCLFNIKGQLWLFFGDGVTARTIKAAPVNDPYERNPPVKTILLSTEIWEGGMVESPNFLYHDGYLYMYYNGQNPNKERSIGVSFFQLGVM